MLKSQTNDARAEKFQQTEANRCQRVTQPVAKRLNKKKKMEKIFKLNMNRLTVLRSIKSYLF